GSVWLGDSQAANYRDLATRAITSNDVEIDTQQNTSLAAKIVGIGNGKNYALVVRWDRPRPVAVFGESRLRYLRLGGLLLTALLLCYALARYLSSPIG